MRALQLHTQFLPSRPTQELAFVHETDLFGFTLTIVTHQAEHLKQCEEGKIQSTEVIRRGISKHMIILSSRIETHKW